MARPPFKISLTAALLFVLGPTARGATLYVAGNGVDPPGCSGCGEKTTPCRSIGCGIVNAVAGDKVVVGPGRYGDLNRSGILGDTGEENPALYAPGCGCVVALNKAVTVTSSDGAAATLIDALQVDVLQNVLLITDGGGFGKPGKGFTVTATGSSTPTGIGIDSTNVSVEGNQVIGQSVTSGGVSAGIGIFTVDSPGLVLIAGNQVVGWGHGIRPNGTGKTVRKNVVVHNGGGIVGAEDADVVGNVVSGNFGPGITLFVTGNVVGNALLGNIDGIVINSGAFTGTIEGNNIFANLGCGVSHLSSGVGNVLDVPKNYWGAATGPGSDPADGVCTGGTAIATPFATAPFKVKARIKP